MKKLIIGVVLTYFAFNTNAQEADAFCCKDVKPYEIIMDLSTALQQTQTATMLDLSMQSPKIVTIPQELSQCINLKCLNLGFNRIATIPESFKKLKNLTCLILSGNHSLQNLPLFLNDMPNLKVIMLEDLNWSAAKKKEMQEKFPGIILVF